MNLIYPSFIILWLFLEFSSGTAYEPGGPIANIFTNFSKTPPPGFDHERVAELKTSPPYDYPDGQHCDTGQEPFNLTEANLIMDFKIEELFVSYAEQQSLRKKVEVTVEEFKEELFRKGFAGTRTYFDFRPMVNESSRLKVRCQSGMCHYNITNFSPVCGPRPKNSFLYGQSCIDGAEPLPEQQLGGLRKARKDEDFKIIPRFKYEMKALAKDDYLAQNCLSKHCEFDFLRDWFICASSTTRPKPIWLFKLVPPTLVCVYFMK